MKKAKSKIKPFLKYYAVFSSLGLFSLLFYQKGQFELWVNSFHHPFFDVFFKTITPLGDGAIVIFPLLILVLFRYSHALILLWAALFHILFVNLGKRVLFKGFPRPAEFLKDIDFYQVPGVELHHWNSFPSGHTTTIFMLCTVLAMVLPKRLRLQPLLFVLAVLVGLSRIYLMQHFLIDVFVGSALGVGSALLGYRLTVAFFSKKKFQRGLLSKRKGLQPQPSN